VIAADDMSANPAVAGVFGTPCRRPDPLEEGDGTAQTRGFVRRELMARPGVWVCLIRTPPESVSDVPKAVIHRKVNTATEENVALTFRRGSGAPVFNVQSPASAE
jgi:hypothetical protein